MADAQMGKDYEEMERVSQLAIMRGLEVSQVLASAETRMRRETQDDLMSRYDADLVAKYPGLVK